MTVDNSKKPTLAPKNTVIFEEKRHYGIGERRALYQAGATAILGLYAGLTFDVASMNTYVSTALAAISFVGNINDLDTYSERMPIDPMPVGTRWIKNIFYPGSQPFNERVEHDEDRFKNL